MYRSGLRCFQSSQAVVIYVDSPRFFDWAKSRLTAASRPMPAVQKNGRSPTMPTSIRTIQASFSTFTARTGSRLIPRCRARPSPLPQGMMPRAFSDPSKPFPTSLTVPSPPTATTMSASEARAISSASPARKVCRTSKLQRLRSK